MMAGIQELEKQVDIVKNASDAKRIKWMQSPKWIGYPEGN